MSEGRKLATIECIEKLEPIEGADFILKATVRGWSVVVKKDEFNEGDPCVFFEIDSFIPATESNRGVFSFLDGTDGRDTTRVNDEGERGWVLKTRKLRGVYSQGLALSMDSIVLRPQVFKYAEYPPGFDVSDYFGIKVYERPMNAQQRGLARGTRPQFVEKTDEPRIQNMKWALEKWAGFDWVATQKLDGSSMSVYYDGRERRVGVTSRNMDLKRTEDSVWWKVAEELMLDQIVSSFGQDDTVVLQGELFGGSIQGNPLKTDLDFRAFNLVVDGVTIPRDDWPDEIKAISVPTFDLPFPADLEEALAQADAVHTQIGNGRVEGLVWRVRNKAYDPETGERLSFKVISNKYLLKHDQ